MKEEKKEQNPNMEEKNIYIIHLYVYLTKVSICVDGVSSDERLNRRIERQKM